MGDHLISSLTYRALGEGYSLGPAGFTRQLAAPCDCLTGQILVKHVRVLVVRNPLFFAINLRMSFICCIFDLNKTNIMKQLTINEMRKALEDKNIKGVALLKNTEVRYEYQKLFKYLDI